MAKLENGGSSPSREENGADRLDDSHDPYFPPIMTLPLVEVPTGEDDEEEIFRIRSKLYRFQVGSDEDPPEWKERGTGDVRLLRHRTEGHIRLLMRRDKTLRVCANHFIRPWMLLKKAVGNERRGFIWQVHADFADEEPKAEVLAIRFSSSENADKFKAAFDSAVLEVAENEAMAIKAEGDSETCTSLEPKSGAASPSSSAEAATGEAEAPEGQGDKEDEKEVAEQLEKLDVKE